MSGLYNAEKYENFKVNETQTWLHSNCPLNVSKLIKQFDYFLASGCHSPYSLGSPVPRVPDDWLVINTSQRRVHPHARILITSFLMPIACWLLHSLPFYVVNLIRVS
jgi:hypothetical protein